jgi:hypothetical protein
MWPFQVHTAKRVDDITTLRPARLRHPVRRYDSNSHRVPRILLLLLLLHKADDGGGRDGGSRE